eukprot:scaffold317337_cov42-Prasinocladus_malaysianus.AAC.1
MNNNNNANDNDIGSDNNNDDGSSNNTNNGNDNNDTNEKCYGYSNKKKDHSSDDNHAYLMSMRIGVVRVDTCSQDNASSINPPTPWLGSRSAMPLQSGTLSASKVATSIAHRAMARRQDETVLSAGPVGSST